MYKDHWRTEVVNFRLELKARLTQAISNQIDLEQLYSQAIRLAVSALRTAEPDFAQRPPKAYPWTLAEAMDDDFWPE